MVVDGGTCSEIFREPECVGGGLWSDGTDVAAGAVVLLGVIWAIGENVSCWRAGGDMVGEVLLGLVHETL